MAKIDDTIRMAGRVDEVLPNAMFRILLENQHTITATLGGRLRKNNIRILSCEGCNYS